MQNSRFGDKSAAPVSVINNLVKSVLEQPTPTLQDASYFIPSNKFQGPKAGYYFGTGLKGLGYYRDVGAKSDAPESTRAVLDPESLLKEAEKAARIDEVASLDTKALRRLIHGFQRKYKENMELRLKYGDQPDKFLESEVDLHEHIKSLTQVASVPDLYPVLIDSGVVPELLAALGHENGDISGDVIELLMEITDADAVEDNEDEAGQLVDALSEQHALELLVTRFTSLDEKVEDEARAVWNALAVIDHMLEVRPALGEEMVTRTKLLRWLLARVRIKEFDANKQYASELLAILVQGSEANQRRVGEANGIDTLLQAVAPYKSREPSPGGEEELLQNCFDALCCCLMVPENKAAFVKSEGVELMVLMMKQRRQARYGAIKALDFATTRYPPACERFVDAAGLRSLFAFFMGSARVKGPGGEGDVQSEVEERVLSLIANLLHQMSRGSRRDRVAAKFVENEYEKCDRLMEFYFRFQEKLAAEEERLAEEAEDDIDPDDLLLARMDAGLFTLQQICLIIGHLWTSSDLGLRKRVLATLHLKGHTLSYIKSYLLEYYRAIGDEGGAEERQRQRTRLMPVMEALGIPPPPDEEEGDEAQPPALPPPLPGENGKLDEEEEEEEGALPPLQPPPALPPLPSGENSRAARGGGENGTSDKARSSSAREEGKRSRKDEGRETQEEPAADRHRDRERTREADRTQVDRGHKDKEKERGRDKDRDKDREREKEMAVAVEKGKEMEREREREREREKEKEKDRTHKRDKRDRDYDDYYGRRDRERERDEEYYDRKEKKKEKR